MSLKVLYLTVPSFFDLEISLIRELSRYCNLTVMLIVQPSSMRSSAFCVNELYSKCCIVKASDYEEMNRFHDLIDTNIWYVANNPDNSLWSGFVLSNKIRKFIKEGNFDLIHSTTSCKTTFFLLPIIYYFKNTLYTVHDPIPHNKKSWINRILTCDIYYKCFNNLLLLSNSLEEEFKKINKNKYKHIYHSSLSIYDYLTKLEMEDNDYGKYILFFGRIDYYKGVDLLIDAYDNSEACKKGIKLIIAGKTSKGVSVSVDNPNILFFNRYIDNNELASLIKHSLFVVLPYRTATQSGCVFSAYAFNKPILATKVGDIPKQISEETGHLIQPNDKESIIEGINHMLNVDLSAMIEKINAKYSGNGSFSWQSIASRMADIYNLIVNG